MGLTWLGVKLFLSEDLPSKVGEKFQDHFQAKKMSIGSSDDFPPGFEDNHLRNQSKAKLSHIPQIKWECPSLFTLSNDWRVAAGEDSTETCDQKLREMRVPEAIYPRISAIPDGPSESEKEFYDDNESLIPLIPLIPVEEEEESAEDIEPDSSIKKLHKQNSQQQYIPPAISLVNPECSNVNSHCSGKPLGATSSEADIIAAASSAAVASIIKRNEQGTLIDMDLLVKLFTDPTMIEKLIEQNRTATTTVSVSAPSNILSIPTSYSKPAAVASETTPTTTRPSITSVPSVSLPKPVPPQTVTRHKPPSIPTPHMHRPVKKNTPHMANRVLPSLNTHSPQQGLKRAAPSLASVSSSELKTVTVSSASANMHAVEKQVQSTTTGAVKDVNYYLNLVKEHGTHKQAGKKSLKNLQGLKPSQGEVKFKSKKPCIYFRTKRGCRNGSDCPYQHDMSNRGEAGKVLMAQQNAKRLKVGPEIKGRLYT
ncbi:Zinc finger CCCH domain-containing protein 6 [Glycine max]|nr:Zinc finger CCCH domain-containing protein 6 [Glycine max]